MSRAHRAVVAFNAEFLKRALGLPEDCVIEQCRGNNDAVEFKVRHKDLAELEDDQRLPVLCPFISMHKGDWPRLLDWNADRPVGCVETGPVNLIRPPLGAN